MSYYKKNKSIGNRSSNEEDIGSIVTKLLKAYGLTSNYSEFEAVNAYKKIMGAPIVKYTKNIYVKNKRMYVELTSSVIREELSMGKSKIINMINDELNKKAILDIVFI